MIEFTVYGRPQPQGSTRAFVLKNGPVPRAIVTSDNAKLKPWRQDLTQLAAWAMRTAKQPTWIAGEAVHVSIVFTFQRPQKRKGRFKTTKPDIDKLVRAVLDGLTSVVFDDDSQVAQVSATKQYGSPERTFIRVKGATE